MAEESRLAKNGMRLGILGSAASLAFAFPLANGNYDTTCQTIITRTGYYGDATVNAQKFGFVVGGKDCISFQADATHAKIVNNMNAVALPAPATPADTLIHVGNVDGVSSRILIDSFGSGFTSIFTGRFARGTNAAPTAVQSGDTLASLNAIGYGATAYGTTGNAAITITANENWTDTTKATKITLELTPTGSTTRTGYWSISPTLATQLITDATTNVVSQAATWNHQTSGTPAVGFGTGLQLQGYDDGAATQRVMLQFNTSWVDPVSATRTSKVALNVVVNGTVTQLLNLAPAGSTITMSDAVTNTAPTLLQLTHVSSGTAANNFGSAIQINGPDDGGTSRGMAILKTVWTTAASATRASSFSIAVQVAAVSTVGFTLNPTSLNIAAGFPATFADTTNSTTASSGAITTPGGISCAKNITFNGTTGASLRIVTATANGAVLVTLGVGPTGSTAGNPQGWCIINVAGTDRFFPFW